MSLSVSKMVCFQAFYLFALFANLGFASGKPECSKFKAKTELKKPCHQNFTEVYHDDYSTGIKYMCCDPDSDAYKHQENSATSCSSTYCVSTSAGGGDLCANYIGTRTIKSTGKKVKFLEAVRDDCTQHNRRPGVEALCCAENSQELYLTTLLGAELHEFPHFARLETSDGKKVGICGGTVYNERFIITASHCVIDKPSKGPKPVDKFKIILDVLISGKRTKNEYDIEEVFIHPNASLIQPGKHPLNYDIAMLKLTEDIQFSDNIQALPLAPKGFKPLDYGDTAIIVGFGDTDTLTTSKKLQKADAYIRKPGPLVSRGGRYPQHKKDVDQLLFLGGYQDGIPSPSGSGGDSGGPALCRDKDGMAVLCGLTSFGPNNKDECEKHKDEANCFPTAYVKVDYFRDWIEKNAGDQKKARVMKQPLYGKDVSYDKYPHQVNISSSEKGAHMCGGTLIENNVVLTAAHCVANDNGKMKEGLTVTRRESGKAQTEKVKNIKVLDGFKRIGKKSNGRPRRIAMFATEATWDDPYYTNDLALVKLQKPINVSSRKLPKLAESEAEPGSATEIAWETGQRRKGKLAERKFNLMTHHECQRRMARLTYAGYNIKVDENIVCGVEEYSGGSKCDRTVGGGVLCEGNTLCGVQVFRLCEFAVPSTFMDVGSSSEWIRETIQSM